MRLCMTQDALDDLLIRAQFVQVRSDTAAEPVPVILVDLVTLDDWKDDSLSQLYAYVSAAPQWLRLPKKILSRTYFRVMLRCNRARRQESRTAMMNHRANLAALANGPTRRQVIAGVAMVFSSLVLASGKSWGGRRRDLSFGRIHSSRACFQGEPEARLRCAYGKQTV
jgi:hypothetical protein